MDAFHQAAEQLGATVRSRPKGFRWFLHCDNDADGVCAAAVVALALTRIGHRFQVRASREKTQAEYEGLAAIDCDGIIILDKGTSHLRDLARIATDTRRPVLVIDHHNLVGEPPEEVHLLNPRAVGLDGSNDASSATSAVAFALALDPGAWRWGPIGLMGAIGDWQHQGGWDGWNQRIVTTCIEKGILTQHFRPAFIGMDLIDGLVQQGPPIPELGDRHEAASFLESIDVAAVDDIASLDEPAAERLVTAIASAALAHGIKPGRLVHRTLGTAHFPDLRKGFRLVDACAREGRPDLALATLMGDTSAEHEADAVYDQYSKALHGLLERLRQQGPQTRAACRVFNVDQAAYTGMVAGLGMTIVLRGGTPLVVHAPRPDGLIQVSTRGDGESVQRGLDLGVACREAGRRVDREGGGHPIAAGVVVAPDELDRFLDALDEVLSKQGFLVDA